MNATGEQEGHGREALCWQWVERHELVTVARMEGVSVSGSPAWTLLQHDNVGFKCHCPRLDFSVAHRLHFFVKCDGSQQRYFFILGVGTDG